MIQTNIIPTSSGIYKFTNKVNNKCYIGQAKNLKQRIKCHIKDYNRSKYDNLYFYNSIRKHGIENFELEILQEGNFSKKELDEMEITFIRLFKSNNPLFGYNLTLNGEGTSGFKHSLKTIEKQKQIKIGKKASQETKDKMSKVRKGKILSEEHKQKISKSNKGKPKSQEFKFNLKGHLVSEETREKLSKVNKGRNLGRKMSKEVIEKRKKSRQGYKHTEETKQKMVETRMKNKSYFHSEETKKKIGESSKGKKYSQEEKDKMNLKKAKTKEFNKNMKLIKENNFVYDWLF